MRTTSLIPVLLALLTHCTVRLLPPKESRIACNGPEDCPKDYTCRTSIGLCLPTAALEDIPATPSEVALTPEYGRRDRVFTVAFSVDEPLDHDPTVRVQAGASVFALDLDETQTDRDARRYVFAFVFPDAAAEGAWPVLVSLVDASGNASDTPLGQLTLDNTPPRFEVLRALAPTALRRQTQATVRVAPSEPLAQTPSLALDRDGSAVPMALEIAKDSDGAYEATIDVGADAPLSAEGSASLVIHAVDRAGNEASATLGALALDFTPPTRTSVLIAPADAQARPGQIVSVSIETSEVLAGTPALGASDGTFAFTAAARVGTVASYVYAVPTLVDGTYDLELSALSDAAGNVTPAASIGPLRIDGAPPVISGFTQNKTALIATDTLTISFDVDEALTGEPQVKLGNLAMNRQGTGTSPYVYALSLIGTALVGSFPIQVQVTDILKNSATQIVGSATIDSAVPGLVDIFFSPPSARNGVTALLTITASETLNVAPVLSWAAGPAPGFTFQQVAGLNYTFTWAIDGLATPGDYVLNSVTLTDVAGNPATYTNLNSPKLPATFSVDNVAPLVTLTQLTPAHGRLREDTAFTVRATCNDPAAALGVTIAGKPMIVQTTHGPCDKTYTYTPDQQAMLPDTEGSKIILAQATDVAGNTGLAQQPVFFDFTKPGFLAAGPTKSAYKKGDTITYVVTFDEPVTTIVDFAKRGADPELAAFFDAALGNVTTYTFTRLVEPAWTQAQDGAYTVRLVVDDVAGNQQSITFNGAGQLFSVDTLKPVIGAAWIGPPGSVVSLQWSKRMTHASHVAGFDNYDLAFEVDPDTVTGDYASQFDEAFTIEHNGAFVSTLGCTTIWMDFGCQNGFSTGTCYVVGCPFTVPVGAMVDGPHAALITISDDGGNTSQSAASITWDFIGPSVDAATWSIAYDPATTNPLSVVDKATAGTTVRASFSMNEDILRNAGGVPVITAASTSPQVLSFTRTTPNASFRLFTFEHTLADLSPLTSDNYTLAVTATDLAGNPSTTTMSAVAQRFKVDTTLPPLFTTNGSLLYARAPWGTTASVAVVSELRSQGLVFTSTDGKHVAVYDQPSAPRSRFGIVALTSTSAFPTLPIATGGRARVYATVVDSAGNESAAALVTDNEITYSLRQKTAANTVSNPTVLEVSDHDRNVLDPGALAWAEPSDSGIDSAESTGNGTLLLVHGGRWRQLVSKSLRPPGRRDHDLVYDNVRGKVLAYGGTLFNGVLDEEVWEWDGDTRGWKKLLTNGIRPAARAHGMVTFDTHRGRLVLFGGEVSGAKTNEIWELDIGTLTWINRTQGVGMGPSPRSQGTMAYDPRLRRSVMHGGLTAASIELRETWEWDGIAGTWTLTDQNPAQHPQFNHRSTFDPLRGVLRASGRCSVALCGTGGIDSNTYSYNTTLHAWQFHATANNPLWLSGREGYGLAYSFEGQRSLLFGGYNESFMAQNDLWELGDFGAACTNGSPCWRPLATTNPPFVRGATAMTFDRADNELVVFGGDVGGCMEDGGVTICSDTWLMDKTLQWTHWLDTGQNPSAAPGNVLAYDPSRAIAVLVDPSNSRLYEWSDAQRTFNYVTWIPGAGGPSVRSDAAVAYDSIRQKVILFGGIQPSGTCNGAAGQVCSDTWGYGLWGWPTCASALIPCWKDLTTEAPPRPQPRERHTLVADTGGNRLLLFGGAAGSSTVWSYAVHGLAICSSATIPCWRQIANVTEPGNRYNPAVAWDDKADKLIVFGGVRLTDGSPPCSPQTSEGPLEICGDTWEWQNGTWTERSPATTPLPTRTAAAAFDSDREEVLLLEGSKLWAYNATSFSWVNRTPIGGDRPIPRARPAVAWHPVRNELFVFGGSDSGTQLSDLWAYDSGARTLPALRWRLPLQASGESLATISSLLSFNVASRAAGVGYAIGSPVGVNGSRLDVWDTVDGSYTALSGASNNAAPVGAPGTLNGTRSSHATILPLLFGADESLFLRVAPIANAGNRGATNGLVELDAIDATLRYRLP